MPPSPISSRCSSGSRSADSRRRSLPAPCAHLRAGHDLQADPGRIVIARAGPPSVHALGLAGTALGLLCAAALLPLDAPPLSLLVCPIRAATGIPCLACGCTHAFHF